MLVSDGPSCMRRLLLRQELGPEIDRLLKTHRHSLYRETKMMGAEFD